MSEKMYPIPFKSLMNWIVTEYAREGEIFGVHTPYYATGKTLPIFGERIETPFGPAAGPNSQRFKNVLPPRPCRFTEKTRWKWLCLPSCRERTCCCLAAKRQEKMCCAKPYRGCSAGHPTTFRSTSIQIVHP